jgi:hypothetical protein
MRSRARCRNNLRLHYHGIIPATKRFAVPYACIVVEFGDAPDALLADCQFRSLT